MKKKISTVFIYIISVVCIFAFSIRSFAVSKEYSWFCVRCGNKQPAVTKEEILINKYGAFCLDRGVNDASERKVIYITFDAGYENGNVERILNVLNNEGVTAAFFVLDNIILKNTDLVTRIADEGHLICNHTRNHKNICNFSKEEIIKNLNSLEDIYYEATGKKMAKFFRFPEGRYNEAALEVINEMGYRTVFWSFAYDDWDNKRQPNRERAISKVLNNTHNGAVFLFHPTSDVNADIFPTLIKEWKAMGYEFGALTDIS